MTMVAVYVLAAMAEIAGCFAFWAWLRLDKSPLWIMPGVACLIAFAWLLTRIEAESPAQPGLGQRAGREGARCC